MSVELVDRISRHFTIEELEDLCFRLDIEYEDISGDTLQLRSLRLVKYCKRHSRLNELVSKCRELRSEIDWGDDGRSTYESSSSKSAIQDSSNNQPIAEERRLEGYVEVNVDLTLSDWMSKTRDFFDMRFRKAFPGVRGIGTFRNPIEAVERLTIFFSEPLSIGNNYPIWWLGRGNMYIQSFKVLASDTILMDHYELIIDELAAVYMGTSYPSFIYLSAKAARDMP